MILHIPAHSRGQTRIDWLDSRHSFSFADYRDPARMGWGALRVINDDLIAPGGGFGTHPHRDMEILSYVTAGAMAHRDSTGQQGVIGAGQFQLMSAGTGIAHSEFNASRQEPLRLLQIWILPAARGGRPGYQQHAFERRAGLQPIATPDGREGSFRIGQDATVSRLLLEAGQGLVLGLPGRRLYLHLVAGALQAGEQRLAPGDGLGLLPEAGLPVTASETTEALVFDLPA